MSRPQTIEDALADLPTQSTTSFSLLSSRPRGPLLRTKLRPSSSSKSAAVTTNGDTDTEMSGTTSAATNNNAVVWTPERRTAWSYQRSVNRGVKEATIAEGEMVQSVEFSSIPHNPFLEARSSAIPRFVNLNIAQPSTPSHIPSKTDDHFIKSSLENEEDEDEDDKIMDASFLEASDDETERPKKKTKQQQDVGYDSDGDGDEVLPSKFVEYLKKELGKEYYSIEKRKGILPADFAGYWEKSGRGGVSNRMIVAQQAFFAGEDLRDRDSPVKSKGKEKAKEKESPVKVKPKGKSVKQKQMDRLLGGKRRR